MNCPKCNSPHNSVLDSRSTPTHIRRRRVCSVPLCEWRWTTYEYLETEVSPRVVQFAKEHKIAAGYIETILNCSSELTEASKALKGWGARLKQKREEDGVQAEHQAEA